MAAQACHASTACLAHYREDPAVIQYTCRENRMTMTTIILSVADEEELYYFQDQLRQSSVDFFSWREQPENTLTAIALKPYSKSELPAYLSTLKLFK